MKALEKLAEYLVGLGALPWVIFLGSAFITHGDSMRWLHELDDGLIPYGFLGGMAMILLGTVIMALLALTRDLRKRPPQNNPHPDQASG